MSKLVLPSSLGRRPSPQRWAALPFHRTSVSRQLRVIRIRWPPTFDAQDDWGFKRSLLLRSLPVEMDPAKAWLMSRCLTRPYASPVAVWQVLHEIRQRFDGMGRLTLLNARAFGVTWSPIRIRRSAWTWLDSFRGGWSTEVKGRGPFRQLEVRAWQDQIQPDYSNDTVPSAWMNSWMND